MQRPCAVCGRPFEAQRPTAKYCGSTCRVRACRGDVPTPAPATDLPPDLPQQGGALGLVAAVTAELTAAGRENSSLGVQALELARRMSQFDTGGGLAALSKELRSVMAAALQNAAVAADPLDELKRRRDEKRAAS